MASMVIALQCLPALLPASLRQPVIAPLRRVPHPACCEAPPSPTPPSPPSLPAPSPAGKSPAREIDPRGFVVPQVGDVVKMPSKWPGEYDVAQVDYVQFIGSRGAYEVDLLPLSPMGQSLYRMPGRKPAAIRCDVGKLGRLEAEYVAANDAYRVDESALLPLGGKKTADPSVTEQGLMEYSALKADLLREAVLLGAVGSLAALPLYGTDIATTFAAGSAAGCAYLLLLQKETDAVAGQPLPKALAAAAGGRLFIPFVLMVFLAARQAPHFPLPTPHPARLCPPHRAPHTAHRIPDTADTADTPHSTLHTPHHDTPPHTPSPTISRTHTRPLSPCQGGDGPVSLASVPRTQFVAGVLGFLSYKVPYLLLNTYY